MKLGDVLKLTYYEYAYPTNVKDIYFVVYGHRTLAQDWFGVELCMLTQSFAKDKQGECCFYTMLHKLGHGSGNCLSWSNIT